MVNTTGVKCGGGGAALPLSTLNHVSLVCRSLASSLTFYRDFLGFVSVRRPGSFDFDGACMEAVQRRLKEMGVRYVQRRVEEGGVYVDQIFFHDPDGFMIEICTCDKLPVVPLDAGAGGHSIFGRSPPPPPVACCKRAPVSIGGGGGGGCVGEVIVVDASNGAAAGAMT
uniref:VOC domain-containing protein n=1 Tax=Oryza punctata TaxID=4537 RepID=A0A0E0JEP8_ORYPU